MDDSTFDLDKLKAQQATLRHHGRLHWVHWVILALSVIITIVAWHFSNSMLQSRALNRFDREANHVVDKLRERLSHYEDALRSGSATLLAYNGSMTRDRWKAYATELDLTNRYPGVNGIGVIREVSAKSIASFEAHHQLSWPEFRIYPNHDFPIKLPIVYIEPAQPNLAAIGMDVAHEENRRTAALDARDKGLPQISGPITLAQDDGKTPGFLFYMPFYLTDIGFDGLVYAPLVVKNLVEGVMGKQERQVFFSISDGYNVLYDELSDNPRSSNNVSHSTAIRSQFYGRVWTFTIHASDAFHNQSGAIQPLVVLLSGLTIDAMLLALFLMMTRSNHTVLTLADKMISRLGDQASTLAIKNSELESFAYVVSHDLKTPIRAISSLSDFIEEDIDELITSDSTKDTIKAHTQRINEQVIKSDSLIKGILNYSIAGVVNEVPESVDVAVLIDGIRQSLDIPCDNITVGSGMPVLETYASHLTQIIENLLGNAYKYHPRPSEANIQITVEDNGHYHRFYVADDGIGIDLKYRDRVFEPFVTLQSHPSATSSGIGLSIVKKLVEVLGGKVGIVDTRSQGTTLFFDWPKEAHPFEEVIRNAA